MNEEGTHVHESAFCRRAHICRQQERPNFAHECTRLGAAADPRANLGWVQKGLGQALDTDAYIQRVLTLKPLGSLRERNADASLVLRENGQG